MPEPPTKPETVPGPQAGARHAALAVLSRRRLLEALQVATEPVDAARLASAVGLHVTTARFHLDVLERTGLVSRAAERGGRPGRPRQLYRAVASAEATEGHRQLAGVLAAALAGDPDGGPRRAEQAGRRWAAAQLPVEDSRPMGAATMGEATQRVTDLFDRLGFAPTSVRSGNQHHLELRACPFRDIARDYPEVVCTVHLGLLRGALQHAGQPAGQADRAGLRPFVEPELCIADLPGRRSQRSV